MDEGGPRFSERTERWLRRVPVEQRKRLGQYMTPRSLRNRLLDACDLAPGMRVLDPGVGTGEFLRSLAAREPTAELHGWDVDPDVLEVARGNVPEARLDQRSALEAGASPRFDLIVGNPPYFQLKPSPELRSRFQSVISGRTNIFALFFKVARDLVRDGGQVAYLVPPSMNNGAYFESLRRYLTQHASIEHLEVIHDQKLFDGAQTPVQLLVLRKGGPDPGHFSLVRHGHPDVAFSRTVLSEDTARLRNAFEGRRNLYELGYEAVTGTIVWNQKAHLLRRKRTANSVPLIWAHNVADTLRLRDDHQRPQYLRWRTPRMLGPAIVVNRIVGAVGSAELRCAPVPRGMEFVGENHVNVIVRHGRFRAKMEWEELLAALRRSDTGRHVRLLTGNTQISATELTHLVPV